MSSSRSTETTFPIDVGDEITVSEPGEHYLRVGIVSDLSTSGRECSVSFVDSTQEDVVFKVESIVCIRKSKPNQVTIHDLERRLRILETRFETLLINTSIQNKNKVNESKKEFITSNAKQNKIVDRNDEPKNPMPRPLQLQDDVVIRWSRNIWNGRRYPEEGKTGKVVKLSKEYAWVETQDGKIYKKKKHNVTLI